MKLPWTENTITSFPDHAYGSSKLIIENLLRDFQIEKKYICRDITLFQSRRIHSSGLTEDQKLKQQICCIHYKLFRGKKK